ncbi:MAG: hypothetical protein GX437_12115 [Sphingobacteriales bacterium]|nr:hypothetical protein [Sphingobacteriales bacterium]
METVKRGVVLLLLAVVMTAGNSFSQAKFFFGYNLGTFTIPQRYFQVIDYEYQIAYGSKGYSEKGFGLSPLLHGFSYSFRLSFLDNFALNVSHYRKVTKSRVAEFPNNYLAQHQMIIKSWGVGFVFREDYPKFGVDYEVGRLTLKKKKYPADEFKSSKWIDYCPTIELFGKGPTFSSGITFYSIHRLKFLEIRPYFSWIPEVVNYPDYTNPNLPRYYTFRISSIGIHLFVVLGEND